MDGTPSPRRGMLSHHCFFGWIPLYDSYFYVANLNGIGSKVRFLSQAVPEIVFKTIFTSEWSLNSDLSVWLFALLSKLWDGGSDFDLPCN